jgi:hypothetical protein
VGRLVGRAGGEWERCCGMDVRVVEKAEVDREEDGKVPPCGDGLGGEAAREVRRVWAWRSSPKGSGGGEGSTGRGERWGPRPWGESRGESRGRGLEIG